MTSPLDAPPQNLRMNTKSHPNCLAPTLFSYMDQTTEREAALETRASETVVERHTEQVQSDGAIQDCSPESETQGERSGNGNVDSSDTETTPPAQRGDMQNQNSSRAQVSPQGHENGPSTRTKLPKEYLSWKLKNRTLCSVMALTIALIAVIAVLDVLSRRNSGFVTISQQENSIAKFLGGEGLLWTSIPTFLFGLYRMAFDSIVSACASRQPFVELNREPRTSGHAKRTILLDYQSEISLVRWKTALKNSHYLLAASFVTSLIFSLGTHSLAAHLFTTNTVSSGSEVSVNVQTALDSSSGFLASTDLRPTIDTVGATLLYGGNPPAWTTGNYSFPQLAVAPISGDSGEISNFSVQTTGYYATLDCREIQPSEYDAPLTLTSPTSGTITFSASDRGCQINQDLVLSLGTTLYLRTHALINCDYDAGYSRVFAFGALLPNLTNFAYPQNFSAISCIPQYWSVGGILNLTLGVTSSPLFQSFTASSASPTDSRPDFWRVFENALSQIITLDNTGETSTTDFGRIINKLSQISHPDSYMEGRNLANATSATFTAIWAMLGTQVLMKPIAKASTTGGVLFKSKTRLFVVSQVAYSIISVLAVIFCLLFWMMLYVRYHRSTLYEEPKGLLGHCGLLCESDIFGKAEEIRARPAYDGKMTEAWASEEKGRLMERNRFGFSDWDNPNKSRIIMVEI